VTRRTCLLAAGLLAVATPTARAEEPTPDQMIEHAVRSLYDGRWEHARRWRDAWHERLEPESPSWRPPEAGGDVGIVGWRTTWNVRKYGGLVSTDAPRYDAHSNSFRPERHVDPAVALLDPTFDLARYAATDAFGPVVLLAYERAWRETLGMARGPTKSPLTLLPDPEGHMARFLGWQREIHRPTPPEKSTDAEWAAKARAVRVHAEDLQGSARRLAWLAGLGLLVLTLGLGARLGRRPRQG
jgi:hypothetical protein